MAKKLPPSPCFYSTYAILLGGSSVKEYLDRGWSFSELKNELRKLISKYNRRTGNFLFLDVGAIGKPIPNSKMALCYDDFFFIRDFLSDTKNPNLDFFIETPGGIGEVVEDIVRFLRDQFKTIRFVIAGQAKSAGTILVLSGDEILMTKTASLGPIDAQMIIGRSTISAYDYMEWVKEKRNEAEKSGRLNPFDATMIAQITPGEIGHVSNALDFAIVLVQKWLVEYKFKNWNKTETQGRFVTKKDKEKRAREIAEDLTNHSKWKSHGRSIKIEDLEDIGLKINRIDDQPEIAEEIYKIYTVCKLIFDNTTVYKIFGIEGNIICLNAVSPKGTSVDSNQGLIKVPTPKKPDVVTIDYKCPQCHIVHRLYAKFIQNSSVDKDLKNQGYKPFPKNAILKCDCGFETDVNGIKNEIELIQKRKVVLE